MPYDPEKHHRRSIRLPGHDYSDEGAHFVTICTHEREPWLGEIVAGTMRLSHYGQLVEREWLQTPSIRPEVEMGPYVLMPNHIHGMIVVHCRRGVWPYAPTETSPSAATAPPMDASHTPTGLRSPSETLGALIRGFKGATTKQINVLRAAPGTPVWQRNYYEHIIRNDREWDAIAEYVVNNPIQWAVDHENPAASRR